MSGIARINDRCTGVCAHPSHGTPIATGGTIIGHASVSYGDVGREFARLTDKVQTDCGHFGYISSASATVYIEGKQVARLGDTVSPAPDGHYTATITGASSTILTS